MARSVSCQFFLTPEETIEVVSRVIAPLDIQTYVKLRQGGPTVLERVTDLDSVLDRPGPRPTIRDLTSQELEPVPGDNLFDGDSKGLGTIRIFIPFVEGDRFFLGSAGAKFLDEHDSDAKAARSLVRAFKRRSPGRLLCRSLTTGATVPGGVGISDHALRLAAEQGLRLAQLGVDLTEFVVATGV